MSWRWRWDKSDSNPLLLLLWLFGLWFRAVVAMLAASLPLRMDGVGDDEASEARSWW